MFTKFTQRKQVAQQAKIRPIWSPWSLLRRKCFSRIMSGGHSRLSSLHCLGWWTGKSRVIITVCLEPILRLLNLLLQRHRWSTHGLELFCNEKEINIYLLSKRTRLLLEL
jgi:hypothetical protein